MGKILFVTQPQHDTMTSYLMEYSKEYADFAHKKGFEVIAFSEERCSRKQVESLISGKNPQLVILNGHGSPEAICGRRSSGNKSIKCLTIEDNLEDEIIIDMKNKDILKSKITYSLACASAKNIGRCVAELDQKTAFIGYEDDLIILTNTWHECKPREDDVARAFLEPSNQLVISLLKGHDVETACKKSQECFQKWLDYFQSDKIDIRTSQSIAWILYDNMKCQIFHGNARLSLC